MSEREHDQSVLSRLVGCWQGTLLHRTHADQPFRALVAKSDNRWVLGGRFIEMTLHADTWGEAWSAVFYIGYERSERRHVLVSLEPDDRRVTTRLGDWRHEQGRLVLTSPQSRAVCDVTIPGQLKARAHRRSGRQGVRAVQRGLPERRPVCGHEVCATARAAAIRHRVNVVRRTSALSAAASIVSDGAVKLLASIEKISNSPPTVWT